MEISSRGQGSPTKIQPNNAPFARKKSRAICSRYNNISDQPSLKENATALLTLYLNLILLKKKTTHPFPTNFTSRLRTSASSILMTLVVFQLPQELETNISWWHTIVMPMQSLLFPSSKSRTRTVWLLTIPSCNASRIGIC